MTSEPSLPPAVIVLNQAYLDDLGPAMSARYVEILVQVAESTRGGTPEEISAALERALASASIPSNDVVRERLAERFAATEWSEVLITTDDGTKLHGPDWDPHEHVPEDQGPADPEHPDRPLYS